MSKRGRSKKIEDEEFISLLEKRRLSTPEIAERLDLTKKTVNRRLDKLEKKGMVTKTEAGQTNIWEKKEPKDPGDIWPEHYRGLKLHFNEDEEVWWRVYRGTGRLLVEGLSRDLIRTMLQYKGEGGSIRITEDKDILTKIPSEDDGDNIEETWLGKLDNSLELVPLDEKGNKLDQHRFPLHPSGLNPGDLWPSIYDGAKYSFVGRDRIWWRSSEGIHYPVIQNFPDDIMKELLYYKSEGGSFRITPKRKIITLVPAHPRPEKAAEQFDALPQNVKKIIKLRKERGLEMIPIYIGEINMEWDLGKPESIVAPLSEEESEQLKDWIKSFGKKSRSSPPEVDDDPEEW